MALTLAMGLNSTMAQFKFGDKFDHEKMMKSQFHDGSIQITDVKLTYKIAETLSQFHDGSIQIELDYCKFC